MQRLRGYKLQIAQHWTISLLHIKWHLNFKLLMLMRWCPSDVGAMYSRNNRRTCASASTLVLRCRELWNEINRPCTCILHNTCYTLELDIDRHEYTGPSIGSRTNFRFMQVYLYNTYCNYCCAPKMPKWVVRTSNILLLINEHHRELFVKLPWPNWKQL